MGHVQLPAWVYLIVIGATLVGVAIGRFPGLRMNRATIALAGATLLIVLGAISLEQAYAAVDLNIILLLFAMMVVNVNLSLAGFFQLVTSWVVRRAASPRVLLDHGAALNLRDEAGATPLELARAAGKTAAAALLAGRRKRAAKG